MQKIAIYMPTFLNFSETFIYSLVRGVRGFELIVICREQKNSKQFPFKSVFVAKRKRDIKIFLEEQKVELIHAQYGIFGTDIMGVAKSLNIPLICHFRGQDAYQLSQNLFIRFSYKKLFKRATKLLTVSNHMREFLINLGAAPDKVAVFYGGINLDKFEPYPFIK